MLILYMIIAFICLVVPLILTILNIINLFKKKKIKENLKKKLSSKRYEHTIGVEYTSTCLAMRYGVDIEKARIAGLLHDCAKYLPKIRFPSVKAMEFLFQTTNERIRNYFMQSLEHVLQMKYMV